MRARGILSLLCSVPSLALLGYGAASGLAWWGAANELGGAPLRLRGEPNGESRGLSARDVLRAAEAVEEKGILDRSCAGELHESLTRSFWVRDASVNRAHRGKLLAKIRLRQPLCAIDGCNWCVLDEEAVVLPAKRTGGLVAIEGARSPEASVLEPGKRWPGEDVVAAVEAVRELRHLATVSKVLIRREEEKVSCVATLSSGTKVIWGGPGDGRTKAKKFGRALEAIERSGRRASHIDLRFSRPVFRLAGDE